jgi:hypothetical protein
METLVNIAATTTIETSTSKQQLKGRTPMKRIGFLLRKLASTAPKVSLLAIVAAGLFALSPMAFASCAFSPGWVVTKYASPGQGVTSPFTINGIAEFWPADGDVTGFFAVGGDFGTQGNPFVEYYGGPESLYPQSGNVKFRLPSSSTGYFSVYIPGYAKPGQKAYLSTSISSWFSSCAAGLTVIVDCLTPPPNMVAWYPFDQSGASQQDLTSHKNTATAYGSYTTVAGEVSNAMHFDGASAYVQAVDQPQLDIGTGDFSIDAWVKIASSADDTGIVVLLDKRDSSTGYHMFLWDRNPGLQLADSSGYTNYRSTAVVPADNKWHLLAVTVVRNSHTGITWYLDGAPVGNFDPTAHTGSVSSPAPLVIGVRSANQYGGGFFKGSIDELEIFNRALSSGEVLSLYQAGSYGKCKQ